MSIKEKLEKNIYLINDAPCIMVMNGYKGIFINKNLPCANEVESFEKVKKTSVQIDKLKAKGFGSDWDFDVEMINIKHFESRQKLDEMLLTQGSRDQNVPEPVQNIELISIQEAFSFTGIELCTNMDFYLKNKQELEADLGRPVLDLDLSNVSDLKRLSQELFYKQMCKLFSQGNYEDEITAVDDIVESNSGNNDSFEKCFILREFHKYLDGNYMYASSRRGNFYILFNFAY
jgi:hypothetical protein